jgi:hypothetical protein
LGSRRIPVDRDHIVLGQALPFSIYRSDNELLLLAKGQVVGSAAMRETLIREGFVTLEKAASGNGANATREDEERPQKNPLVEYERELTAAAEQARVAARISRGKSNESYLSWLLGGDESYGLMFTAPRRADGNMVSLLEGDNCTFRMMHTTAAIKFVGTIRKVLFQPAPLLYVVPGSVEMREVRGCPRVARLALHGFVHERLALTFDATWRVLLAAQ